MKQITLLFMVWQSFLALSGCSIYKAATAPPPLALENVKEGKSRVEIAAAIGLPKSTETIENIRTDYHEFVSGSPEETKKRIFIYMAGDIFSLGVAELFFWPVELTNWQGTKG